MNLLQEYSFPGNVRELIGIIRKGAVSCAMTPFWMIFWPNSSTWKLDSPPERTTPLTLANQALDKIEREMLSKARSTCSGTREMAQFLGVSQATVVRKLQKHGMRPPGNSETHLKTD